MSALVGVAKGTGVNGMSDSVSTSSDEDDDLSSLSERREMLQGLQGQGKTPARTELKATGAAQRLQKGKRNDPVGDEQRLVDLGAKELAGRPEPDVTSAPGSGAAAPASIDASSPAPPETEHDPKKPTPGVVTANETA